MARVPVDLNNEFSVKDKKLIFIFSLFVPHISGSMNSRERVVIISAYPLTASVMPKNEGSGTTGSPKKVRPKKKEKMPSNFNKFHFSTCNI